MSEILNKEDLENHCNDFEKKFLDMVKDLRF